MIRRWGACRLAGGMLLVIGLAACSNPSGTAASVPPASAADSFGPTFGTAFRADPNSAPITPTASQVAPVNPTGSPVVVN
jgi:hypothetical protein